MSGNWTREILDMDEGRRKKKRSIELFDWTLAKASGFILMNIRDDNVCSRRACTPA
jgi:hypothetical protein